MPGLLRSYRRLVVVLDGFLYAGFVAGAYWSVTHPPMAIILSLLGQRVQPDYAGSS